jgi:hypothetical protein
MSFNLDVQSAFLGTMVRTNAESGSKRREENDAQVHVGKKQLVACVAVLSIVPRP